MKQVRIYPFNERGVVENVKGSVPYIIAEKLNNGIKLEAGDLMYITEKVNENSFFKDSIPLQGVRFDFSDFLFAFLYFLLFCSPLLTCEPISGLFLPLTPPAEGFAPGCAPTPHRPWTGQ